MKDKIIWAMMVYYYAFFLRKKNAFPFPPKKYVFFRQIDIEIRLLTSKEPHKLCERQDYLGNDGVIMFYKSSSGP